MRLNKSFHWIDLFFPYRVNPQIFVHVEVRVEENHSMQCYVSKQWGKTQSIKKELYTRSNPLQKTLKFPAYLQFHYDSRSICSWGTNPWISLEWEEPVVAIMSVPCLFDQCIHNSTHDSTVWSTKNLRLVIAYLRWIIHLS